MNKIKIKYNIQQQNQRLIRKRETIISLLPKHYFAFNEIYL